MPYTTTYTFEQKVPEDQLRSSLTKAGIKDPRKEIGSAEVHDCFTITELIIYESLGFCPRGTAPAEVEKGSFELAGDLPVNTDGGLKSDSKDLEQNMSVATMALSSFLNSSIRLGVSPVSASVFSQPTTPGRTARRSAHCAPARSARSPGAGAACARNCRSGLRAAAMSPSGGLMTTVEPCITWSPVKSVRSSSSR